MTLFRKTLHMAIKWSGPKWCVTFTLYLGTFALFSLELQQMVEVCSRPPAIGEFGVDARRLHDGAWSAGPRTPATYSCSRFFLDLAASSHIANSCLKKTKQTNDWMPLRAALCTHCAGVSRWLSATPCLSASSVCINCCLGRTTLKVALRVRCLLLVFFFFFFFKLFLFLSLHHPRFNFPQWLSSLCEVLSSRLLWWTTLRHHSRGVLCHEWDFWRDTSRMTPEK